MRKVLTLFIILVLSVQARTQNKLRTDSLRIQYQDSNLQIHYLQANELQALIKDSLQWYLNHGYPFAEIRAQITSGALPSLTLQTNKGPFVKWGALQIKPEGIIAAKTTERLLQIQPGAPFAQEQLEQLSLQIEGNLPFQLKRAPEWAYQQEQAAVYLFLERTKISSATGILGLQQNPFNQKNTLVGELNVQLQNAWQKNEKFNLHWRSIAPQTQQLKSSLLWPYIAGSSYGLAAGFSLYKRDSSFLELRSNAGLTYLLAKNWQLLVQLDYWRSAQLSANIAPNSVQNFHLLSYGLGLQRQHVDFLPNPRKGMMFKALYAVGNKQSTAQALTWRIELAQRYYWMLSKRQVLSFSQLFNHVSAPTLVNNELYRFGGLERMRGFDEDAYFASSIAFVGLEYRFLLDQYAHILVFNDWAWLNNQVTAQATALYSVGFGLAMGNENGQIKLSFGLGTPFGQNLQLNAGKLHVGYISYF
ncbi:MAG: BamA/TamA family outer membrane protein [Flavobacteriales bacterium]